MECGHEYCLYNKDFFCILKEIELDSTGMCESCIRVYLSPEELGPMKEKQLRELDERYEKGRH